MAIGLEDAERNSKRKTLPIDRSVTLESPEAPQPLTSHGIAKRGRSLAHERRPEGDADPSWWLDANWMSVQQPMLVERLIKPILDFESEMLSSPWLNKMKKPTNWVRRLSQRVSKRPAFPSVFLNQK